MILFLTLVVLLIRKLSKIQLRKPIIHIVFERAKSRIQNDMTKTKTELSTLDAMKKGNLLPKGYYEKAKEVLKQKIKNLHKELKKSL